MVRRVLFRALRRFTVAHDAVQFNWYLRNESTGKIVRRFHTKAEATASGVLQGLLGPDGGTVRIHNLDGTFDEERTFPRERDPRSSPG